VDGTLLAFPEQFVIVHVGYVFESTHTREIAAIASSIVLLPEPFGPVRIVRGLGLKSDRDITNTLEVLKHDSTQQINSQYIRLSDENKKLGFVSCALRGFGL